VQFFAVHVPQLDFDEEAPSCPLDLYAKALNSFVTLAPLHCGQRISSEAFTSISKQKSHSLQVYS